jgi:hypothetical protein
VKKITWEAWIDPYNSNKDQFGNNKVFNTFNPQNIDKLDLEDREEPVFGLSPQPTIATPYGLLSITEDTIASSRFDFWLLHTNFDITHEFVALLEQISGIETIEVFTRYRMRLGFPKTPFFNITDTKIKVEKLIEKLNEESIITHFENIAQTYGRDISNKIQNIYNNIVKNKFWNIYIYPNGQTDIIICDTYDSFIKKIDLIKDVKVMVGGININSEEI